MDTIWRGLLWSFKQLQKGRRPSKNWNGESFESIWRGDLARENLCGDLLPWEFNVGVDLDYLCNYFGVQQFNDGREPCFKCKCNRTTIPWTDRRPDAAWTRCPRTHADWFLAQRHALFDSGLGLTVKHVSLDVMQVFVLGMCRYIVATVIYMAVSLTQVWVGT